MALPLIAVVAALNTGGHLVAHSAGGLIVYSKATGGYVAGTYIGTATLASFLTGTAVVAGATSVAAVSGSAMWAYGTVAGGVASLVGAAGLFGTTIGATGITGLLMSWGLLPAVPVIVPVFFGVLAILIGAVAAYSAVRVGKLRRKAISTPEGEEAHFTNSEVRVAEKIIRNAVRPHTWIWRKWMAFWVRVAEKQSGDVTSSQRSK